MTSPPPLSPVTDDSPLSPVLSHSRDRTPVRSPDPSLTSSPPLKQRRLASIFDIGVFVSERSSGRRVSDDNKYSLIVNQPSPSETDILVSHTGNRRFQRAWLSHFKWLRYSKHDNGGYCLPCVLFATNTSQRADPSVLVRKPLINFRKALELLRLHADKGYHKSAVLSMEAFQKVMTNAQPSIAHQIDLASQQQIASNRVKLQSIVETVILCGRQNIPLRGHRDSSYDLERNPTAPHGNFWALLDFRISAGDRVLQDHLTNAPANAKYTSPSIQNEIADISGQETDLA